MLIKSLIKRDITAKIEGVVKVFDRASLADEFREYVVTDKIESHVKSIIDSFTQQSEALRRGGTPRDVMGIWISGFFGSGKSHFAKVLGYLLQNNSLSPYSAEKCIDVFLKHLSDSPRGNSLSLRLRELERTTQVETILFEIKSRQSLTNPNSVGEILLGEFYRHIGFAENFVVARIERRLDRRGLLQKLEQSYESRFKIPWKHPEARDDLLTVRHRLAELLPVIEPAEYQDRSEAKRALDDMFRHEKITAEGIAEELVAWVNDQKVAGGKMQHLVFVIDEMGTFIGDSTEKISELNSIAEMIGNKGKGKVWMIATSQHDLEKVVDRTNFQPALVGRLNARFELKPHLISDEINKVVSERILKKIPSEKSIIRDLFRRNEGHIAQLADLKASRHLGNVDENGFVACYPFLPHQIQLAQDIFERLSGFRLSGGVRSMISVVMEALQEVANEKVGAILSFDQIFDAVENDLLSQEYLGTAGVRAISESGERVPGTPVDPARVLKVLWLLQQITWVPRIPENLAKLLVRDFDTDIAPLRQQVEETLAMLQDAGYVAKDEATGEWKYLNERERTIEQAIQEMIRTGGPRSISISSLRRTSQQMCKEALTTKKKLNNFTVLSGRTKVPFQFAVHLDGEAVETGPDLEVAFISPLAAGRKQEIEEILKQNQISGIKGQRLWWVAGTPENLETRFKRFEALVKITGDKRFTEDSSGETQAALSEKRKERDELKTALVGDLQKAFLSGTLFYSGQERELEGEVDFREPLNKALLSVIPNLYPRFQDADREFDFAKQVKAFLNPAAVSLHQIAPNLDMFDTQGALQRESVLVSQALEKGFSRPPFGWPTELVRLVLAACLRAGAIYLEEPTGAGLVPKYDYKATDDLFLKINTFKKILLRVSETSLSVDQLKEAGKLLISMDVTGTAESGNAIAAAIRKLGGQFKSNIEEAGHIAESGLPITEIILKGEAVLKESTTTKDPTKAVLAFLSKAEEWKKLYSELKTLSIFILKKRHQEFRTSRIITELAINHPIPPDHPKRGALEQGLKDIEAIITQKEVVSRWSDYREAYEAILNTYRDAYQNAYGKICQDVESTVDRIMRGIAYKSAPIDQRDSVLDQVFGPGGPCHYPSISLMSTGMLISATSKHSLTSLTQASMAMLGYQSQVEAKLRCLALPAGPPDEMTWLWSPADSLVGRRFRLESEIDDILQAIAQELKEQIRKGYTVIVK
ncbi:MAG: BREX system P-loop protein BrxC [Syntrophobacteraceae bacterium]